AEENDVLVRPEDVLEKWLIEPDRPHAARLIAHEHLEDLEPRTPRRTDAAAQHFPTHRRGSVRLERRDRLEVATVLVPYWKPIQEVLDRDQTRVLQIRGAPRPDAFQILERSLEWITGQSSCFLARS